MRTHETELLEHIISLNNMKSAGRNDIEHILLVMSQEKLVKQAFDLLQCEQVGTVSPEFIGHQTVIAFINNQYDASLKFWYFIQTNELAAIEERIKAMTSKYHEERRQGRGIPPDGLYSVTLVRSVYLSENAALIDIFKRYLPIPGVDVFKGYEIPTVVTGNKALIEQSIQALRERAPRVSLDEITNNVLKIQRRVRANVRHQEEIKRIASRKEWAALIEETSAEQVIQDANTPYRPRCADKPLAERIMLAAKQVRLFSTVRHVTSAQHIQTIFNDSLYGRRQLLESYLPFRPASLHGCDIADGDANVICFAPFDIAPEVMRADMLEVLFDLSKISKNNPSNFFKQRDLGFALDRKREVSIPGTSHSLFFSHTNSVRCETAGFVYLSVYDGESGGIQGRATLPNYSLMSYNVKNIHQILTLNFFRFLDATISEGFASIRNELYAALATCSEEELLAFLKNIGQQLSDTSEFNFYGAHQIDFSTVIALSYYQNKYRASYTLNLQDLIGSLEQNDISMLNEAKAHIPGALNSYRFLDYLLSKTSSIHGRYELQRLRSKCITPPWVESIPEPEPFVMPEEDCSAAVLVEETPPLDELITTDSVDEVGALSVNVESQDEGSMPHVNEVAVSVIPALVNEARPSDIAAQDHIKTEDQSSIIAEQVIVAPIEENDSGANIHLISAELNQPILSSEGALIAEQDAAPSLIDSNPTLATANAPATWLDSESNCLPSSFIISLYATGSVLLIAGVLACALLNPVVAALAGLTLTVAVVGVLAAVGSVGIVAGATTILSTWCGYFKPADTRRAEQSIVEPQCSAQAVLV